MKLCCSIAPRTVREARTRLATLAGREDIVEIRVDGIAKPDFTKLLRRPRLPVIITNRGTREGGSFAGPASVQVKILEDAAQQGAEFIDIEASRGAGCIGPATPHASKTKT